MRTATWARWWFLAFAAVLIGELVSGWDVMPFTGTLTMAALLAWALAGPALDQGRPGRLLAGGLALLTAAVVLAEAAPDYSGGLALVASLLVGLGVSALAGSVLARAADRRARRFRVRMLPAVVFAVLVGMLTAFLALEAPGDPDLLDALSVLLFPAAGLALAGFAINAGLTRRGPLREAAVALLPLLIATAGVLFVVAENDLVAGRVEYSGWEQEAWREVPSPPGALRSTATLTEYDATITSYAYTSNLVLETDPVPEPEPAPLPALLLSLLLLSLVTLTAGFPLSDLTLYSYRNGG